MSYVGRIHVFMSLLPDKGKGMNAGKKQCKNKILEVSHPATSVITD